MKTFFQSVFVIFRFYNRSVERSETEGGGGVIWWGHNLPLLLLVAIGLFNLFNSEGTIAFPAPSSYILYSTEMPLVFQIWMGKQ